MKPKNKLADTIWRVDLLIGNGTKHLIFAMTLDMLGHFYSLDELIPPCSDP
jgi:hypothetical protein